MSHEDITDASERSPQQLWCLCGHVMEEKLGYKANGLGAVSQTMGRIGALKKKTIPRFSAHTVRFYLSLGTKGT